MNEKLTDQDVLIKQKDCALVIIDMQERLLPVISEKETIIENTVRLIQFAHTVALPIVLTEQKNLGRTVPEIQERLGTIQPIPKLEFNSFESDEFRARLEKTGKQTLIITGVEAHICVAQTALWGIRHYDVQVVGDAISSRSLHNREIAVQRMRREGIIVTSTEMVIYELLRKAGTPEFKEALRLVTKKP